MFDISFSELVLIFIVGLLVFGPEKLPEVVRTTGLWINKLRRMFNQFRAEIEREVGVEELKRDFHNHSIMQNLKDAQQDLQSAKRELQNLPYEVSDIVEQAHAAEPKSSSAAAEPTVSPEPAAPREPGADAAAPTQDSRRDNA